MTKAQHKESKRITDAATPGPWDIGRIPTGSCGGSNTVWKIGPFAACIYDDWRPRAAGISERENESNANLIAHARTALPAYQQALEESVELLRECLGMNRSSWETNVADFLNRWETVTES